MPGAILSCAARSSQALSFGLALMTLCADEISWMPAAGAAGFGEPVGVGVGVAADTVVVGADTDVPAACWPCPGLAGGCCCCCCCCCCVPPLGGVVPGLGFAFADGPSVEAASFFQNIKLSNDFAGFQLTTSAAINPATVTEPASTGMTIHLIGWRTLLRFCLIPYRPQSSTYSRLIGGCLQHNRKILHRKSYRFIISKRLMHME